MINPRPAAARPIFGPHRDGFPLALFLTVAFLTPGAASADQRLRLSPLWSAIATHENNLFSTPADRQADFLWRTTAGLDAAYRATRWTLLGRCSFDVERFADHPDLSTVDARQHAAVGLEYRPSRTLSIASDAELSRTHAPGELNGETGLVFTRAAAQRSSTRSTMTRQFNRASAGTVEYGFTEDRLAGVRSRTHSASAGADRSLSARVTAHLTYRVRRFGFESAGLDSAATSHAMTFGITRKVTPQVEASVEAGPRVTDGSPAPEFSMGVHRRAAPVDLRVKYAETQTAVIGLARIADTRSVVAAVGWDGRRALQIRVTPAYFHSTDRSLRADVSRLEIDVARPVAPGTSLHITFDTGIQRGTLFTALESATIPHQTVSISLIRAPVAEGR